MSLFSSISPSPSKQPSRRASFSPMSVTNILNSMYARPPPSNINEGRSSAGSHDWSSGSQGHYTLRRMKSQEELARPKAKAQRLADRPKTSAGGGSRSAIRMFTAPIEPAPASSPTDTSTSPPRQLSPSESRVSNETSSTSSTLRLVGRGGSGSKYRVVAPRPPTLDISQLSKPVVACEAQPPPPEPVAFHRPTGRGGVGARKKSNDALPAPVLTRLPLKKVLSTKFRKNSLSGKSVRSVESIPESSTSSPQFPHHISTGSLSTFHTTSSDGIHQSPRSIPECDDEIEEFLDGYLPPLSPSSSTFEDTSGCATPASAPKRGNLNKLAKMLGELPPHEIYENLYRQQHLMQAVPAHIEQLPNQRATIKTSRRSSLSASIYSIFSSVRNPGSTVSQHTVSTSTEGHGLHPGIFADDASDSWGRSSVTGGTDDSHSQPGIRCDTPESPILFSPPSPDLVPLHGVNESTTTPNLINGPSDSRPLIPTLSIDTLSLDLADPPPTVCPSSPSSSPTTPVSTLHRSKSHSHALRRSTVRTSRSASLSLGVDGLNATASFIVTDHGDDRQLDESRASTPFPAMIDGHKQQSQRLPELAHWLKPPNVPVETYYESNLLSAYRSESPATRQSWSGEWNTDMQDVIRGLRLLR